MVGTFFDGDFQSLEVLGGTQSLVRDTTMGVGAFGLIERLPCATITTMATLGKPSGLSAVDRSVWVELLRLMIRSRRTEERLIRLYHQGQIFGGVYTGIGQEAIGAASVLACNPEDLFAPAIRDMSVHLGRGETLANMFRQWLAREGRPTRGRDGNIHNGNLKNGVYPMISHLGAMIPVVVGGVMAKRFRGINAIGVAYMGEGTTSTGDFHEGVNFAAVRDVPVIMMLENNQYAYSTPTNLQYRCRQLIDKAPGYGIEGVRCDGNDAIGLYLTCREIVTSIRAKPRPFLVECDTMRMRGHGEHDDSSYVPKEMLERYAAKDPILVASKRLIQERILTEAEITEMDSACVAEVDRAANEALSEPPPDPSSLQRGVYGGE